MSHYPTRGRCQKTFERREKLLAILAPGKRVKAERLHREVMPDHSRASFRTMLREMRRDGYVIEPDGCGASYRGHRLIAQPAA